MFIIWSIIYFLVKQNEDKYIHICFPSKAFLLSVAEKKEEKSYETVKFDYGNI